MAMKSIFFASADRGKTEAGWLHSRHSFSFGDFYDPKRMGFGLLRVLNDDIIDANSGFGMHPHQNMEIVTIVLEGGLAHSDSMGNRGVLEAGDVQRMSAGRGVFHSEINASKTKPGHFLQIWVETNQLELEPEYEQKKISFLDSNNKLLPLVSANHKDALSIHQNAAFWMGSFEPKSRGSFSPANSENGVYLFLAKGKIEVNQRQLVSGDALAITDAKKIDFAAIDPSLVLLIETPLVRKA